MLQIIDIKDENNFFVYDSQDFAIEVINRKDIAQYVASGGIVTNVVYGRDKGIQLQDKVNAKGRTMLEYTILTRHFIHNRFMLNGLGYYSTNEKTIFYYKDKAVLLNYATKIIKFVQISGTIYEVHLDNTVILIKDRSIVSVDGALDSKIVNCNDNMFRSVASPIA